MNVRNRVYIERHRKKPGILPGTRQNVVVSPREQARRNLAAIEAGYIRDKPDSSQGDRVRRADEMMLAIVQRQPIWSRLQDACENKNVAIVGAGLSLSDLKPEHFDGISAAFGANSATNGIPQIEGLSIFGVHSDEMPSPEVRVPVDVICLSCLNVRLHPFHNKILIMPDTSILRPMGSQALCVWLARLAGAKSLTMLCCDSVLGDNGRWEEIEPVSYSWHPGCTITIARGLPITWICPGWDDEIAQPAPHCMTWGTAYERYEPAKNTLIRGGVRC